MTKYTFSSPAINIYGTCKVQMILIAALHIEEGDGEKVTPYN